MGIARIIRRDLGDQFAWSRNCHDTFTVKCRRLFWSAVYLVKGIVIGRRGMLREQLGSAVKYEGRVCFISNWAGSGYPTLADNNGFYESYVPREKITNVLSLKELCHRFDVMFGWYMSSWHAIDVNKRLYRPTEIVSTKDVFQGHDY